MIKRSLVIVIVVFCIYSVNANTKNDAINSAKYSVQYLMQDNLKAEAIKKLEYNPIDNIYYCFFSIYNKNTLMINKINDFEEDDPRFNEPFEKSVLYYRNILGSIISYEITEIKYNYEFLPLYDYGHSYSVEVKLNCNYSNKKTEENIVFYYFKKTKETKIVAYSIVIK